MFDVFERRRRSQRHAMHFAADIAPTNHRSMLVGFPGPELGHVPRLRHQGMGGEQFILHALFPRHVMEHKHHAVFAIHLYGADRHQAWNDALLRAGLHAQLVDPAVAGQRFEQALAFLRAGPDFQLERGAPENLLARRAKHRAKRRIDFYITPIRHTRDATGVRERVGYGAELGFGTQQRGEVAHAALGNRLHLALHGRRQRVGAGERKRHGPSLGDSGCDLSTGIDVLPGDPWRARCPG